MVAIPHEFFKRVVREACGVRLPAAEQYAVMMAFLPKEPEQYHQAKGIVAKCAPAWRKGFAVKTGLGSGLHPHLPGAWLCPECSTVSWCRAVPLSIGTVTAMCAAAWNLHA